MATFNPNGSYAILNTQQGTYFVQGGHYFSTQFSDLGMTAPADYQSMSSERSDNVNITGGSINGVQFNGSGLKITQSTIESTQINGSLIDSTVIGSKTTADAHFSNVYANYAEFLGTIRRYNGVPTVGNGVPAIYAQDINLRNLSGNIASTPLFNIPANTGGMYRVSCYAVETTADGVSSTLPSIGISWTDFDSDVPLVASTVTPTNPANAPGAFAQGSQVIFAKPNTTINYQTSGYASGTAGAMKYSVRINLEYLG